MSTTSKQTCLESRLIVKFQPWKKEASVNARDTIYEDSVSSPAPSGEWQPVAHAEVAEHLLYQSQQKSEIVKATIQPDTTALTRAGGSTTIALELFWCLLCAHFRSVASQTTRLQVCKQGTDTLVYRLVVPKGNFTRRDAVYAPFCGTPVDPANRNDGATGQKQ